LVQFLSEFQLREEILTQIGGIPEENKMGSLEKQVSFVCPEYKKISKTI